MMKTFFSFILLIYLSSCSPIKSSPQDESHQLELNLHEVQTNLDDLRHDIQCFQAELQILDGKIRHQDNLIASLKEQDLKSLEESFHFLSEKVNLSAEKAFMQEKKSSNLEENFQKLSKHANDTTTSLIQFRERIMELEKEIGKQNKKLSDITEVKRSLERLIASIDDQESFVFYTVKSGDSLEKIAKKNQIAIEKLKKINQITDDLIFAGQKIKIPKN